MARERQQKRVGNRRRPHEPRNALAPGGAAHSVPLIDYVFKPGERRPTEIFWCFYFIATGLHAIHLSIGIVLVLLLTVRAAQGAFSPDYDAPLEVIGLYWSFVDCVWFFLFACIYPLGRAGP